jgi:hypothetical protein
MNLVNPGPMSSEWFDLVGLSAFLVFIFSMVLFAIWLYLEPTKHPQHRRRRNQLGGGV